MIRTTYIALFLICSFVCLQGANAKELTNQNDLAVAIADSHIGVTVGFEGAYIRVFGDRRDKDTVVAIIVEGPEEDTVIWKKSRVMGAWINRYFTKFEKVPTYYQYAVSTSNIDTSLSNVFKQNRVGNAALLGGLKTKKSSSVKDISIYSKALIDKKKVQQMFFENPEPFVFLNDHFFKVSFRIPASARTGEYRIRTMLIKNDKIIHSAVELMTIEQVGLNAFINQAAKTYSLVYALVCIGFALSTGWLISVLKVKP